MPRRNRHQDEDFEIHVDPSCVSAPTHDDLAMMEHEELVGVAAGEAETGEVDVASQHSREPETDMDNEREPTDAAQAEEQEVSAVDCKSHQEPAAEEQEASIVETETPEAAEEKTSTAENTPTIEDNTSTTEEGTPIAEENTPAVEDELPEHPADQAYIVESEAPGPATEEDAEEAEPSAGHDSASILDHQATAESEVDADEPSVLDHQATAESEADADEPDSRRQSATSLASHTTNATHTSDRRTSHRTEALIHAAARDIVARLGTRERESTASATPAEDDGCVAESAPPSTRPSYGGDESVADDSLISNDVDDDDAAAPDEAGDSSSHHEHEGEDDVFSDNSPRSSMGSMDEAEQTKIEQTLSQRNITQRTRSPRISDIPQSDPDEDFVPTVRGTPRPPFRSPSSIHALQMSSPPASARGTPRSSRRTPLPTVSRLGSPSVSAQYSPKKTPPRFKRATPPLVLLHVTLLPLRWSWGHVLDAAQTSDLSAPAKSLREAWRQLRDRTGDTVSDRGILLPHPQNDYEVLEERLLEALELPLRRRARILECGHYLGPANEMSLPEEADSDDGDYADSTRSSRAALDRTHWCRTCRSEIRVDSLGQGKVFRVKVYASNGLMRAGAWEACWKEMERVDVELEPIADADLQEELAHLALEQERALEMQEAMAEELAEEDKDDDDDIGEESYVEQPEAREQSSPPPDDDRRARDEERLREIYGHTPPAHAEAAPERPRQSEFTPRETPPSPSVEACGRREERRQAYKSASLPELVLEAAKVLMQDKKNVMIGLLSILIMMLAVRGGTPSHDPAAFQTVVKGPEPPLVTASQAPVEEIVATAEAITATASFESSTASAAVQATAEVGDPCEQRSSSVEAVEVSLSTQDVATTTTTSTSTSTSTSILLVVETVTETVKETVVATETIAETIAVTTSVEAAPSVEAEVEVDAVETGLAPENNEIEV